MVGTHACFSVCNRLPHVCAVCVASRLGIARSKTVRQWPKPKMLEESEEARPVPVKSILSARELEIRAVPTPLRTGCAGDWSGK